MRTSPVRLILVPFLLAWCAGTRASAYSLLTNGAWSASTSSVVMQLQFGTSSGTFLDGSTSWGQVAENAMYDWNQKLGRIQFRVVRDSTAAIGDGNSLNNMFWNSTVYGQAFTSGALAVTTRWSINGIRSEGDVVFNTAYHWNSYRGNLRTYSSTEYLQDFKRVALHELGHVLGLDHPDQHGQNVVAVMNSASSNTDALTADDIAGATALYGAASTSRLTNMSVRIGAGTGSDTLIVGVVIGGAGSSGTKPLLLRAVGPTLSTYGVAGVLADPTMDFIPQGSSTALATNDNWSGNAQVTSVGNSLGAFPFSSSTSKDAALYLTPGAGAYSMKVSGVGGTSGIALAEIYDASGSAYTSSTPRLINVSARAQVGTGDGVLIAGFVVDGTAPCTVLIRGVGPTLSSYGVAGVLTDPRLDLSQTTNGTSTVIASNDDWGGNAQIASTANSVGAFALASSTSKDAAVLVTLQPGVYSAKVSGVGNTTGVALVEVYEVP